MTNIEALNRLRGGDASFVDQKFIKNINDSIMKYLSNRVPINMLNKAELDDMDAILRICNIFYNQTDLNVLPVEDGVYDIFLEYYKTLNPNFQVGSEVIRFPASDKIEESEEKINPFITYSDEEMKKIRDGLFYDELRLNSRYTLYHPYTVNPFLNAGTISKRTHNTSNNHPDLVGTLDKAKFVLSIDADEKGVLSDSNVAVLERDFFFDHIQKGIITPTQELCMVLELKYDGISVEADCDGFVQSARTRGDTGIGQAADISPIIAGYPFPNAMNLGLGEIGVKFEAIMTKTDLMRFNQARRTDYKNCRTAIVGLFGSGDGNMFRNYITLVPLEIDRKNVPNSKWNRVLEIEFLNKYYATKGCPLRYAVIHGDYKSCLFQIKKFLEEAEIARKYLDFMYDGIVVSYLDENIRAKLGRKNHVNKYSMAVKFNAMKRLTRVIGYTFHVGQNGSITPKVHYEPVEFFGTIHPQSTINSYARFMSMELREGDIIEVEYVNDVIDRVTGRVDCAENAQNAKMRQPIPFTPVCPICGAPVIISDTGKTAYCSNKMCPGRELARVVNMMSKLNLKDFGESRIAALNVHSLKEMMEKKEEELLPILGEAFTKTFLERMRTLQTEQIPDYLIFGALGFTGISTAKWKLVFERMTMKEFFHLYQTNSLSLPLRNINGVGDSMVSVIMEEMPYFIEDVKMIIDMPNITDTFGKTGGPKVVFTGFRDSDFATYLGIQGYEYKENLTKDTDILVVPVPGFTSTKTGKVGPNTKIVDVNTFKKEVKYI